MRTYIRRFVLLLIVAPFLLCMANSPASAAWQVQTVDPTEGVGYYTSLAFDGSGNPAISYSDGYNADLKFAHDRNGDGAFQDLTDGTAGDEIITVDSTGFVANYTSLAFDGAGNPAISCFDINNINLKYAHFAASSCCPDGDVNGDCQITPGDALSAFHHYL